MNYLKYIGSFIFFLIVLTACVKDLKDFDKKVEWKDIKSEIGFPVVNGEMMMDSLFDRGIDSTLYIDPDSQGILHLYYKDDLDSVGINDILTSIYPKDSVYKLKDLPLLKIQGGLTLSTSDLTITANLDSFAFNQQIDSVILKTGNIHVEFETLDYYDSKSEFGLTFLNIKNSAGQPLKIEKFTPQSGNNKINLNLDNYKLIINTSPSSKGVFSVSMAFTITTKKSQPPGEPKLKISFSNLQVTGIYGKLGNYIHTLNVTKGINLSKKLPVDIKVGNFNLENPTVKLLVKNQMRIPLRLSINQMDMQINGTFTSVTGLPGPVIMTSPALWVDNIYSTTSFALDPNTNIDELLSKFPDTLRILGEIQINPLDSNAYNYIKESDLIIPRVEADIPLHFTLSDVNIGKEDKVDFKSNIDKIKDNVQQIKFQVKFANSFPFEMKIQSYFLDSNKQILDSLFSTPVIINKAISSSSPFEATYWIDKNNEKIVNLKKAEFLQTKAYLQVNGNNTTSGNFLSKQKLNMQIVIFLKTKLG